MSAPDWFTKANFRKWLKAQKAGRRFDYCMPNACMFCAFANEVTGKKHWFLPNFFGQNGGKCRNLPKWAFVLAERLLSPSDNPLFTISDVRKVIKQRGL